MARAGINICYSTHQDSVTLASYARSKKQYEYQKYNPSVKELVKRTKQDKTII